MKTLAQMHLLACLILLLSVNASFSEAYQHTETGIIFPDTLAGIQKVKVTDHEKQCAGLGVSIGYNGPGITATIYLYTMGMKSVPDGPNSLGFLAHFKQIVDDVFQAGNRDSWKNVKKTSEEILPIGHSKSGQRARCASFSYTRDNLDLLSKVCLFTYRNHFVKIRFTYTKNNRTKGDETFRKLLQALADAMGMKPAEQHNNALQRQTELRDAEPYYNQGIAYYEEGKYDQAISEYTKVLEINPRYAEAYNNRGRAYAAKSQYDEAIADFNKVIEIDPKLATAYFNRGIAYRNKGKYDQAIADYTKAIEINPRDADAYNNRGIMYGKKGQYDQETADYTKAIEINPKEAMAYFNRGIAYGKKWQFDQAIADFNKVIEIDPNFTSVYYNRSVIYYFKKEYDRSWEDVKKAQNLGHQIPTKFLEDLRKASGRRN